ncbi:MAG: transposase [Nocardioidaceae bacterium]
MPSVTNKSATVAPVTVSQSYRFVVGVDTHAATHSYAVLDAAGAVVGEQTFPTTTAGIGRALEWIARRTQGELDSVVVAAEGTGSYGAVLAERLAEVGYRVVEAPTPRRERGRGKTDAMARAPQHARPWPCRWLGSGTAVAGQDQVALQVLTTAREQLNAERLRAINALTALVRTHDLGIDARRSLTRTQIRQIAAWRRRSVPVGLTTARTEAVRLAGRVAHLDVELKSNRDQLTAIVADRAPGLLALPGVGAVTAAVVLCVWSHPGRVRSEPRWRRSLAPVPSQRPLATRCDTGSTAAVTDD